MIEVENLRREFQSGKGRQREKSVALDGISFSVSSGETHGLLGPNGAGKTTLTKILSTILVPTSGSARVENLDVVTDTVQVRQKIGIVFGGDRGLYDRITARQNLAFWATLYRVKPSLVKRRVDELLDRLGLAERADEPVERFSRGMRQRLHLARGLIGDPAVLLLDEPTVGMDPVAAREFRELVVQLRTDGRTILMTTHDMREAEALCDRITLIDHGRILLTEKTTNVGRVLSSHDRIDVVLEPHQLGLVEQLGNVSFVDRVDQLDQDSAYRIHVREAEDVRGAMQFLLDQGVTAIQTGQPSLEDVYVQLVGGRGLSV
ncbi:ABC transporter ATP-binding protein [Streptomyces sp. SP17KL33]|uniref:ABC transporter ATP-binding protein n=1 Tax=Streptomyces sp. SP17KL33 TaxID=3002534 RepID=UPI002E79FEF6|nr:ABC transporter ATP-binding protein [Streptomyces sp. SP17KL33]MEE1831718.1 ABC transporter ATP-binding protein [Streptomyces sp. SP17KL33]